MQLVFYCNNRTKQHSVEWRRRKKLRYGFTEAIAIEGACISRTGMRGLKAAGRLAEQSFAWAKALYHAL